MRTVASSLIVLLAGPALGQEVADCAEPPSVTELVEPWEETSVVMGAGAVRLALLHGAGQEGVRLLVLTPQLPEEKPEVAGDALLPSGRRCRIVIEGGLGFAEMDLAAIERAEDPAAATLTARIPAQRFIPESSALEEITLRLTFGPDDGALAAELERPEVVEVEASDAEDEP